MNRGFDIRGRWVPLRYRRGTARLRAQPRVFLDLPLRLSLPSRHFESHGLRELIWHEEGAELKGLNPYGIEASTALGGLVLQLRIGPRTPDLEELAELAVRIVELAETASLQSAWRQLGEELGLRWEPGTLTGVVGRVRVRVHEIEGRVRFDLRFPPCLPEGFETGTELHLAPSSHRFGDPVLDMLLRVRNPPSQRLPEEAVELMLELCHGQGALLRRDRLVLSRPGQVAEPAELLQKCLRLVEVLQS